VESRVDEAAGQALNGSVQGTRESSRRSSATLSGASPHLPQGSQTRMNPSRSTSAKRPRRTASLSLLGPKEGAHYKSRIRARNRRATSAVWWEASRAACPRNRALWATTWFTFNRRLEALVHLSTKVRHLAVVSDLGKR